MGFQCHMLSLFWLSGYSLIISLTSSTQTHWNYKMLIYKANTWEQCLRLACWVVDVYTWPHKVARYLRSINVLWEKWVILGWHSVILSQTWKWCSPSYCSLSRILLYLSLVISVETDWMLSRLPSSFVWYSMQSQNALWWSSAWFIFGFT